MEFVPGAFLPRLVQLMGLMFLRGWITFCFRGSMRRTRHPIPVPCVFVANHRSFFDPPFVGMWQPLPLSYFARSSLWKVPFIRSMLDLMYGIPVDREHPGASSTRGAIQRLRQGISVLVFPEGTRTRSGAMGAMREGPALFARRAGVPLVPVYIHNSEAVWPRGSLLPRPWGPRVEIRFGSPIQPPAHLAPRLQDAWVTRRLTRWLLRQEASLRRPTGALRPSAAPEDAGHG